MNAVFALAAFFGLLILYQFVASWLERRKYPAPGEKIDIGSTKLHAIIGGSGEVTVVFESGAGGFSLDWETVYPEIAGIARTVTYDRAGYAWSETSRTPRDAEHIAEELHTLLERLRVNTPLILVGHSIGGLYVQQYAAKYPDQVKGLVLVDTAHRYTEDQLLAIVPPKQWKTLQPLYHKYFREGSGLIATLTRIVVSPLGLFRIFGLFMGEKLMQFLPAYTVLPEELKPIYRAMFYQTGTFAARIDEAANLAVSAAQVQMNAPHFGDLPVIALSGERMGGTPYRPGMFPELQKAITLHHAGHEAVAKLSTRGKHLIVEKSAHYIHVDRPDVVIACIKRLIED